MIFLTIGTHEPFDRLVQAVDAWCLERGCGDRVFGQITDRATYQPQSFETVARLGPAPYRARCEAAPFIISHAGMGSIITAMSFGKPIVVLPRRGHLQETRNDHQYATALRFEDRPGIIVARDEQALPQVLDKVAAQADAAQARTEPLLQPWASDMLISTLRGFIHQGKDA